MSETKTHLRLKKNLAAILEESGFEVDTEIHFNFSGKKDARSRLLDERSIDVAAWGKQNNKRYLLVFECKSGNISKPSQDMAAWKSQIPKFKSSTLKILASDKNRVKKKNFSQADEVRVCYVFDNKISDTSKIREHAAANDFFVWDDTALQYYKKLVETVERWARFEIFKEFKINFEHTTSCTELAISIKQNKIGMYVMGMHPALLLRIGYVSRRASTKADAYQRILNKDRIKKISEFVANKGALLPNAIIIAFDKEIRNSVTYDRSTYKLTFPKTYCSAWIIDGQHRVFGFLNTKFENDDYENPNHDFKLPVVVLKDIDEVLQNRTFVSINYNQKKIDPTLLCDLATAVKDLSNELTWPSLLVSALNEKDPLKEKVKISELDKEKTISLSSFARYGLLEGLLGFDKKTRLYKGPLNTFTPFNSNKSFKTKENKEVFEKQLDLLVRYFTAVYKNTTDTVEVDDPWRNTKDYALLKPTGVNALLLALSRILEKNPTAAVNFDTYLKPVERKYFKKDFVSQQGGGWKGFRSLANVILKKLNSSHKLNGVRRLRVFGRKDKI